VALTHRYPKIDRELGIRLAAFTDGEGHFAICTNNGDKRQKSYACRFIIKLRDDDLELLERFHQATGLGTLLVHGGGGPTARTRYAQARWAVHAKAECLRLTEIFDEHPLWSKKARDYAIWREAVIHWCSVSAHNGPVDWAPMARWFEEIREARRHPNHLKEVA